jgi:SAM-dependent methyltransferase
MRVAGLRAMLAHPLSAGLDLDDPRTTAIRRRIIREKPFLRRIYDEWYDMVEAALPPGVAPVLELGSGAGYLAERVPQVITSDVMAVPRLHVVADATALPFREASLSGVVLINVLHHVREPASFFREAARVVRPGGRVVMIEPWVTSWSRFVYRRLHHEPFEPAAETWSLPPGGPLSTANSALPWMIFERDKQRFEGAFPHWRVASIRTLMPFRYLLSGGMSMRSLMPGATFAAWRVVESILERAGLRLGMFAFIVLDRTSATS